MPITRSVWIDDDGTGTTGTVLNNAELQKIYNNIDGYVSRLVSSAATGTVHNLNLGPAATHIVLRIDNPAALTITGFTTTTPGSDGDKLTVWAMQAAPVSLVHLGSGSTMKLYNVAQSAPTSIVSGGAATYVRQGSLWALLSHEQGAWITPPFSAADYGGWVVSAGHVTLARYKLSGRTLHWSLYIAGPTLTGVTPVNRAIFGGFTMTTSGYYAFTHAFTDNTGPGIGWGQHTGQISFYKNHAGLGFPAGPIGVSGTGLLEVN